MPDQFIPSQELGLSSKVFNRVLDNYLWGSGTMLSDEYAQMSDEQITIVQAIKRSKKRKGITN